MIAALLLDCEGLAKLVRQSADLTEWLVAAEEEDARVVVSAATIVEVSHPKLSRPRLDWTLSRLNVEPVTKDIAHDAARLLADAGLHGHKHAIDAMICATALRLPRPTAILTSDPADITTLTQAQIRTIKI